MRRPNMHQRSFHGPECATTHALNRMGDATQPIHKRNHRNSSNDELKECCSHTSLYRGCVRCLLFH